MFALCVGTWCHQHAIITSWHPFWYAPTQTPINWRRWWWIDGRKWDFGSNFITCIEIRSVRPSTRIPSIFLFNLIWYRKQSTEFAAFLFLPWSRCLSTRNLRLYSVLSQEQLNENDVLDLVREWMAMGCPHIGRHEPMENPKKLVSSRRRRKDTEFELNRLWRPSKQRNVLIYFDVCFAVIPATDSLCASLETHCTAWKKGGHEKSNEKDGQWRYMCENDVYYYCCCAAQRIAGTKRVFPGRIWSEREHLLCLCLW